MADIVTTPFPHLPSGRPSGHEPMAPGIYYDIPEERYHSGPEISQSAVKDFARAPLCGVTPNETESKPQTFGKVFHTLMLTPDLFAQRFMVTNLDVINDRHQATKDERLKAAGRELVKTKDYDRACAMAESVLKQSALLREMVGVPGMRTEVSGYLVEPETMLPCRWRADATHDAYEAILDFKTAEDVTERPFGNAAARYKYHWQAGSYVHFAPLSGLWVPRNFLFVAIEKEPPYLVEVYQLHPNDIDQGRETLLGYLRRWADCARKGEFPALAGNEPKELTLPAWRE
jgi:hypothetical protein